MNLHRGAPCWSTQIIRTVRRPCSSTSEAVRRAASCCSPFIRPCSRTKPYLPTPRGPAIGVLSSSGGADVEHGGSSTRRGRKVTAALACRTSTAGSFRVIVRARKPDGTLTSRSATVKIDIVGQGREDRKQEPALDLSTGYRDCQDVWRMLAA